MHPYTIGADNHIAHDSDISELPEELARTWLPLSKLIKSETYRHTSIPRCPARNIFEPDPYCQVRIVKETDAMQAAASFTTRSGLRANAAPGLTNSPISRPLIARPARQVKQAQTGRFSRLGHTLMHGPRAWPDSKIEVFKMSRIKRGTACHLQLQ